MRYIAYKQLPIMPYADMLINQGGAFMITEKVGKIIRELRTSRTGLSQEKFTYKIGMDRAYYASVELGRRNIAVVNLEKIANGLEMTLSELFEGVENDE